MPSTDWNWDAMHGYTCEPAGLSQKKGAPGHEEKQSRLQQGEVSQLGELGHVMKTEHQGSKQEVAHSKHAHATFEQFLWGFRYDTKLHKYTIKQLEDGCSVTLLRLTRTLCTWCERKQQVKGYEGGHDSSRYSKCKGSTEDAQEDTEGLQQGHGLKAVAVVSCGLVRHNGAEGRRDRDVHVSIYMENKNKDKEWWKANWSNV